MKTSIKNSILFFFVIFTFACKKEDSTVTPAQLTNGGIYQRQNDALASGAAGIKVQYDGGIGKIIFVTSGSPFTVGMIKWKNFDYSKLTLDDIRTDGSYLASTFTVSQDGKTLIINNKNESTSIIYLRIN